MPATFSGAHPALPESGVGKWLTTAAMWVPVASVLPPSVPPRFMAHGVGCRMRCSCFAGLMLSA